MASVLSNIHAPVGANRNRTRRGRGVGSGLGKTAGKDAAAGKPTYPALYGLQQSRQMATDCLARAASTLQRVNLADSRLLQIGRWIVERSN